MTEGTLRGDIDRVGLSDKAKRILEELVIEECFKDNLSCYRLAISLAIKNKIDISEHIVKRPPGHMYLISQVDPEGIFAKVIVELFPQYKDIKYRALEKFADLGIVYLQKEIEKNHSLIFWENTNETSNLSI